MNKTELANAFTRNLHKVGFGIKKHSPEILVVTGIVAGIGCVITACKATTKAEKIVAESKETVEKIHHIAEDPELSKKYSEEDKKKDLTSTYVKTGLQLAKTYAPAIVLGAVSVTCVLASHKIVKERNVALASAFVAVDKNFKEYRGRVIDRFGKDLDRELRYNIKAKEVEEEVTDENGEKKVVKKTIEVAEPSSHDLFTRCFTKGCKGWSKDPEMNMFYLNQVQNWANNKLQSKGYLFLNEVLDEMGYPRTKIGQEVGWVYYKNPEKNIDGDNYVDFGIFRDMYDSSKTDFINGYESSIWIEFNVDGPILHALA